MDGISVAEAIDILAENFAEWVHDLDLAVIETSASHVTMEITFSERLCRIGGIVCGQALISAADTAMVLALASASGGMRPMTTVDLTCNYMRAIRGEDVELTATVERLGRSIAFCTTRISGARTRQHSAFATGTYAILE